MSVASTVWPVNFTAVVLSASQLAGPSLSQICAKQEARARHCLCAPTQNNKLENVKLFLIFRPVLVVKVSLTNMLITFLVFASLAAVLLLSLLWYLIPSSRVATSVPGLRPADKVWGNLPNIVDAGGLPHFLRTLHCENGAVASFWLGDFLAISVGTHHLFKVVDKSCPQNGLPYQTIVPLTLDKDILEQTSSTFRFINSIFSSFSPFSNLQFQSSLGPKVKKLAEELCSALATMGTDDQVPMDDYVDALAVKIVAETSGFVKETDMSKLRLAFIKLTKELESVMEAGKEVGDEGKKLLTERAEELIKIVNTNSGPKVFTLITVVSTLSTWLLCVGMCRFCHCLKKTPLWVLGCS